MGRKNGQTFEKCFSQGDTVKYNLGGLEWPTMVVLFGSSSGDVKCNYLNKIGEICEFTTDGYFLEKVNV